MVGREQRWPPFGILLLLFELFATIGIGAIPPLTLGLIALQIGLYTKVLVPYLGSWTILPVSSICLNARVVTEHGQLYRLFTAPLFHGSDLHLYYNMISFAWKGIRLEKRYGTIGFVLTILILAGFTGLTYVGLSLAASHYLQESSFLNQCVIGFSGVIFALKVLANDSDGDFGLFFVPKKMAVWAELFIIQLLVPNASFLGHLSGIVAGIVFGHIIPSLLTLLFSAAKAPFDMFRQAPLTCTAGITLSALHMGWLKKPWKTRAFWSSGTPLVCLNYHSVWHKQEYFRLLSGPLEHAGDIHFYICLISVMVKMYHLEQKHPFTRTLVGTIMTSLLTSFTFVAVQAALNAHECVQGLSGPSFGLKALAFLSGSVQIHLFLFEAMELLMLLEESTRIYHMCGLLSGLVVWNVLMKPSRFLGQGIRLGNANPPSTRSWGYAHYTDTQFRRVVEVAPDNNESG